MGKTITRNSQLVSHLSRTATSKRVTKEHPVSDREQLDLIRNLTLAQIAQLRADPKPTYSIDGQTISWTAYVRSLQDTVDWCDAKLIGIEPFEVQSQGIT
jgi:hypothetical protein